MVVSFSLLMALCLDRLFGELRRGHPLVFFGNTARKLETVLLQSADKKRFSPFALRLLGLLGWSLLVMVPVCLSYIFFNWLEVLSTGALSYGLSIVVLYFCLGGRSLAEHARAIAQPLTDGDLDEARTKVGWIVSRETREMDQAAVVKATIESVLENGSDAVLAPLFWFLVAGAPGAICYRLSNTLDAMWGYRNQKYRYFGWAAARLDDLLNWVPARLCALSYALLGNTRLALRCWQQQAPQCESPNAGPVMSAGAGALKITIGGSAIYHGETHWRPELGGGDAAQADDIERALSLLNRTTVLWILVIATIEIGLWL